MDSKASTWPLPLECKLCVSQILAEFVDSVSAQCLGESVVSQDSSVEGFS